jgi:hypothetical protein
MHRMQFIITLDVPDHAPSRHPAYIAQVLGEAAATILMPVPLSEKRKVHSANGNVRYEWRVVKDGPKLTLNPEK